MTTITRLLLTVVLLPLLLSTNHLKAVFAQTILDLSINEYIKNVRENHPKIKIEELNPEIQKTILEEYPVVTGFGGLLSASYQQNINDAPLKAESKILNYGWKYKLLESGTLFEININNTELPINDQNLWDTTAAFTINQPLLYNGLLGNNINLRDITRFEYEISRKTFEVTLSQIILQSLLLYRQYEITKEINTLSRELLKHSQENLKFNQRRVSIGTVSRSEILNSQSQVIRNEIDVQNSDNSLLQLKEAILYNMGYSKLETQNINLIFKDNPEIPATHNQKLSFQEVWEVALREREEFQLYSLQLAAAENAISLGKKALFPELNVFATYSFLGRDASLRKSYANAFSGFCFNHTDLTLGVTFKISTELAKYKLATKRPGQNKELAEKSLVDFQQNLHNDIQSKVRNYKNAYDTYEKNERLVKLARQRYEIAKRDYFIGKLDYSPLVQIEQELKQATIGFLSSKIAYYQAELELENAQGTLSQKYEIE